MFPPPAYTQAELVLMVSMSNPTAIQPFADQPPGLGANRISIPDSLPSIVTALPVKLDNVGTKTLHLAPATSTQASPQVSINEVSTMDNQSMEGTTVHRPLGGPGVVTLGVDDSQYNLTVTALPLKLDTVGSTDADASHDNAIWMVHNNDATNEGGTKTLHPAPATSTQASPLVSINEVDTMIYQKTSMAGSAVHRPLVGHKVETLGVDDNQYNPKVIGAPASLLIGSGEGGSKEDPISSIEAIPKIINNVSQTNEYTPTHPMMTEDHAGLAHSPQAPGWYQQTIDIISPSIVKKFYKMIPNISFLARRTPEPTAKVIHILEDEPQGVHHVAEWWSLPNPKVGRALPPTMMMGPASM